MSQHSKEMEFVWEAVLARTVDIHLDCCKENSSNTSFSPIQKFIRGLVATN